MMNRKEWIRKRAQIPGRDRKNKAIATRLLPFFQERTSAGIYIPSGAEASCGVLWDKTPPVFPGASRMRILAPKVESKTEICFYPVENLSPGVFGILEPAGKSKGQQEEIPEVLVIPMLRFFNGYRVGYGKGYYDRYLCRHPECLRIGIAYDEQEEEFEPARWDERLDVLITPTRTLFFERPCEKAEENGNSQ